MTPCPQGHKGGNHSNAELDVVLAAYSTGPVGIGDAVGYTNATRAKATATADGTILAPDKPWTPVDAAVFPSGLAAIAHPGCFNLTDVCGCNPKLLQSHTVLRAAAPETGASDLTYHHLLAVAVRGPWLMPSSLLYPTVARGTAHLVLRRSSLGHGCRDKAALGQRLQSSPSQRNVTIAGAGPEAEGCVYSAPTGPEGSTVAVPQVGSQMAWRSPASFQLDWQLFNVIPRPGWLQGWALLGELTKYASL